MNRDGARHFAQRFASYEDIALEYYDPVRHPTCLSLRNLSLSFLTPRIRNLLSTKGTLVEVGAGLSVLAPEAVAQNNLSRLVLIDRSLGMLSYSARWIAHGARQLVSTADKIDIPDASASLVVSSLGDPYNDVPFWKEVARILTPDGVCLFTTPSFQWASKFRSNESRNCAEFVRSDGAKLLLPSFILSEQEQSAMIRSAGLSITERAELGVEALGEQIPPKLLSVGLKTPFLTGYVLRPANEFP